MGNLLSNFGEWNFMRKQLREKMELGLAFTVPSGSECEIWAQSLLGKEQVAPGFHLKTKFSHVWDHGWPRVECLMWLKYLHRLAILCAHGIFTSFRATGPEGPDLHLCCVQSLCEHTGLQLVVFLLSLYHDLVVIEMGFFFLKYLILDHHTKGFTLRAEMHLNEVMPIGLYIMEFQLFSNRSCKFHLKSLRKRPVTHTHPGRSRAQFNYKWFWTHGGGYCHSDASCQAWLLQGENAIFLNIQSLSWGTLSRGENLCLLRVWWMF